MMLHVFLTEHRLALIDRCRTNAARRASSTDAPGRHGIPIFLDQLITILRRAGTPDADGLGDTERLTTIFATAATHGAELSLSGATMSQVVHDYGDLCQAITEMVTQQGAAITAREFGTLNRCLDEAVAAAITEFGRRRDQFASAEHALVINERLGSFAHELRNLIGNAVLAVAAIKGGSVGMGGATGGLLDRSLLGLRELVDRTLAEIQQAGKSARYARIEVADLVADVQSGAVLQAAAADRELTVAPIDAGLAIEGDATILAGAIANVLQNAVKFTRPHGRIDLRAYAADDQVLIEVEDECGGLLDGREQAIFQPFEQSGAGGGVGLGLTISRRGVEANGGTLTVRNIAGRGCIFTVTLPRLSRTTRA